MTIPNPIEAWTNPFKYWNDVALMQMEAAVLSYDIASSVNPFLTERTYTVGTQTARAPKRKTKSRRASGRVTPMPNSKSAPVDAPQAKPQVSPVKIEGAVIAAARPATTPTANTASVPKKRAPRKKAVTLAPSLPAAKTGSDT